MKNKIFNKIKNQILKKNWNHKILNNKIITQNNEIMKITVIKKESLKIVYFRKKNLKKPNFLNLIIIIQGTNKISE